ncbi:hypothetical protein CRE_04174 [Caenorhabditis remanei]|uniref:Uncharacterized protein n=1 Tax=Caenorhabditis remanei TaxID=31234 RepID=E3MYT8_CAERE|nr:hypothetical protein CRE_04174 [Caenorhabditis remanei]
MKLLNLVLALLGVHACSAQYSPQSYVDRQCGTDLNNLWLDVIAVVDNSHGMTNGGVQSVAANIASVFSSGTRIGSNSTEPRTTRVGLVTYNSAAKLDADLNKFQDLDGLYNGVFKDLSDVVDTTDSFLATGLNAAEELLQSQSLNTTRDHYKKVIIVYASEYKGSGELDPVPVANRLKGSGVVIVTVAYDQGGDEGLLRDLANIASPGFAYSNAPNNAGNLVGQIQDSLLQSMFLCIIFIFSSYLFTANCFCPNDWTQYRASYSDQKSFRYGVCFLPVNLPAVWNAAKMACRMKSNHAHLAAEFDQSKHDFIFNLAQDSNFKPNPFTYHIGLNFVNGAWVWDQPAGQSPVNLKSWTNWQSSYPKSPASLSGVSNIQTGLTTQWNNVALFVGAQDYVCETYSCDTNNYCDANIVYNN